MNSKGFKNFSKGFNTNNFGSNPRALLPLLLGGAAAYILFKGIYYGINSIYLSRCRTLRNQIQQVFRIVT